NQWPALHAGEYDFINRSSEFLVAQNHAGPRSPERLVRGGGNNLGMRNRRRMYAARDQASEVRHVHQVESTDLVGDLPHAREINNARIGAAAADDHLGPLFFGK